jgi:hypothetical protein
MTYKNALCLAPVIERDWAGLSNRHAYCQRRAGHKGPHSSRFREWLDGERESKRREKTR